MSMEDKFGRVEREGLADTSEERRQAAAEHRHLVDEVERAHRYEAAEGGDGPARRTAWWRFWDRPASG